MSQANRPETGCINMFFQTSALTVGMTKNGAITIRRTMLRPKIGWSSSRASSVPPTTLMTSTATTSFSVLPSAVKKAGIGQEVGVVEEADEALIAGIEQIVAQQRETDRQRQRHDHPQEEER